MSGLLSLVSMGPGHIDQMTPAALAAINEAEVLVGYELYLRPLGQILDSKEVIALPLTQERERAAAALSSARQGKRVALVSSGDIGIYAMATLAFEQMNEADSFAVRVFPGITAASACASLLGAPLSHDFATLSLSDLLCPWEEIEARASHIAAADLAVALYNVQSRTRQSGIYRIIKLMLEHKNAETKCGVVQNAYRPGQSTRFCSLQDLLNDTFDMFTTIVIGNRYTELKRDWMYTPRGYSAWPERPIQTLNAASKPDFVLPQNAVWIFSGTGDGNELANKLLHQGHTVVLSVATAYGAEIAAQSCPQASIVSGHIGAVARCKLMLSNNCASIVDATHPHALAMSTQLIDISNRLGLPYMRYERPQDGLDYSSCIIVNNAMEAALLANSIGKRIFLATGVKHLEEILTVIPEFSSDWFVRMIPDQKSIEKAVALGIPRKNICAMQGPFSVDSNRALWSQWQIDCVITKESGTKSGLKEKQIAAKELTLPMIVIKRPPINYPASCSDEFALLDHLNKPRRQSCQISCQ